MEKVSPARKVRLESLASSIRRAIRESLSPFEMTVASRCCGGALIKAMNKGRIPRRGQRDLLSGFRHLASPRRAAKRLSLGFQPVTEKPPLLSLSRRRLHYSPSNIRRPPAG